MGDTRIICAASIGRDVPGHAAAREGGWLTAEYSLLPYSTSERTGRPLLKRDGRSVEIQRLVGRTLRRAVALKCLAGHGITIDCDVLQADGGTRTAAITGGFIALREATRFMLASGMIARDPLVAEIAGVSTGYVDGQLLLDLDYAEDSRASVDLNVVMDGQGNLVEVQGTGEGAAFTRDELNAMLDVAALGVARLVAIQRTY
jgi:ribonuclease PH